jgi:hypothetical protein
MLLKYDAPEDWQQLFSDELLGLIPADTLERVRRGPHEFVDSPLDLLRQRLGARSLAEPAIEVIRSKEVAAYHGSRLRSSEIRDVMQRGLWPISREQRIARLSRAFRGHPDESRILNEIPVVVDSLLGGAAGQRTGQVHLTLSAAGLLNGFNHYLAAGSEFDQHAAHRLDGKPGYEWLLSDGEAIVFELAVPGEAALASSNRHFTIQDRLNSGEIPNLASDFLRIWAYRLFDADFNPEVLQTDSGLVFDEALPPEWILRSFSPPPEISLYPLS